MKPIKVACVQAAPVFLDLQASLDKAEKLVAEAAANGAGLIAFSETWLPGYPWWIWLGAPVEGVPFLPRYHANAVVQGSAEMRRLQLMARDNRIILVMGYAEREGGTLFISQVIIDEEGTILQSRRKLKPTHVERTIFGEGDGSDLRVVETTAGRLGALNCWEHLQPLNKMAMFAQHEEIHVASWPSFALYRDIAFALGPEVNNSASRIYAVEGLLLCAGALRRDRPAHAGRMHRRRREEAAPDEPAREQGRWRLCDDLWTGRAGTLRAAAGRSGGAALCRS